MRKAKETKTRGVEERGTYGVEGGERRRGRWEKETRGARR